MKQTIMTQNTFIEESRKKDMIDWLEKARRGDETSYINLVDTLEKIYEQFPEPTSQPLLLKSFVGALRREIWPESQRIKNSTWMEVITKETFASLRNQFDTFYKNSIKDAEIQAPVAAASKSKGVE